MKASGLIRLPDLSLETFCAGTPEMKWDLKSFHPADFSRDISLSRIGSEIKIPRKRFIRVLKRDCVAILLRSHPLAPTVESVRARKCLWAASIRSGGFRKFRM